MESQKAIGPRRKWAILILVLMCPFMGALDINIVNVALPVMADRLHVSSGSIAWVASIYMIVMTASILFFGRLGDLWDQSRVFQYGMFVFTAGSLLCSLSKMLGFLLAARGVQAVGAAAIMANSQGMISRTFPPEERGKALGLNGAFVALGTLAGPALGGFILSVAGWQYLFWFNVPIGLTVFAAGFFVFLPPQPGPREKMDLGGAFLFAASMTLFFGAFQSGQSVGFSSPAVLFAAALSVVALLAFILRQLRRSHPLLELSIFKNRWFSVSIFCAFTSYFAISGYNIVFPFYLQDALRFPPAAAGLYMTVYPLIIVLAAPLSGWLSDRIGGEVLTLFGLFLTAAGLISMAALDTKSAAGEIIFFLILTAVGNGLFQSPNNALVMSSLPPARLGVGGSVNALVRSVGQTAGIAAATSLLYGGMSLFLGHRVTDFQQGQTDAFLFGMRVAFLTAAGVCLLGASVTAVRLYGRRLRAGAEES